MTYVLGIDPSLTCTGMALIGKDNSLVISTVTTCASDPLAERLNTIRHAVWAMACEPIPALVCVERPFGGGSAATAARAPVLGAAWGAVLLGLHEALGGSQVLSVPPKVRTKYATGNGNASKDEVLAAAIRRFGYQGSNNNEADALIFAWIAAEVIHTTSEKGSEPEFEYPKLPQHHYDPIDRWFEWEMLL